MLNQRQRAQAENHAKKLFALLGINTDDIPEMVDTPARYVRAFEELTAGWSGSIPFNFTMFDAHNDQVVVARNISYASLCPHHFLPYVGKIHIGYLPNKTVIGLSKMPRLVRWCAAKPQMQEELLGLIADRVMEYADPLGVVVIGQGEHTCCRIRGVRDPEMDVLGSAIRGKHGQSIKNEIISLLEV